MLNIILLKILLGVCSLSVVSTVKVETHTVVEAASIEDTNIEETEVEEDMAENSVSKNVEREKPDVSEQPLLYKKWARISDEWDEVFEHAENYPDSYPENLLSNLKRNPEILDFVYGYLDASLEVQGGMSIKERLQNCPLFIQWDSRWGYVPYGSYNIGISGCGPTCLSMVLYNYLRDEALTPPVLAQKGMDGGYYVPGAGTAWTYLVNVPQEYGLSVKQCQILDEAGMTALLENGGLMVCSMVPGDFTDTGHFILIRGYEDGEFLVNDPFSYTNSYKTWDYETLAKQIKQIWCYEYHEEAFSSGN